MLLAIGLVTALLVGFVLGRLWEMRQRLRLAKPIDVRSRPVEIRAPTKVSEQPPSDDGRLAALDRELNDLLKFAAVQGQHLHKQTVAPR
jgi:hypothetical protein